MKKSRFTEEQIACVLRQADAGTPVADAGRGTGISEATFYCGRRITPAWVAELRKLRQLEDENVRLTRLVANLTLDKHTPQEAIAQESSEAVTP